MHLRLQIRIDRVIWWIQIWQCRLVAQCCILTPTNEERLPRGDRDGPLLVKSELTRISGINTSRIESNANPSFITTQSIVNQAPSSTEPNNPMINSTRSMFSAVSVFVYVAQ